MMRFDAFMGLLLNFATCTSIPPLKSFFQFTSRSISVASTIFGELKKSLIANG